MKASKSSINFFGLILSFVLCTNGVFAQGFINPGAEWNFRNNVSGGNYTRYMQWKYEYDTVLNNFAYNKIGGVVKNFFNDNGPIPTMALEPFLIRSAGDSLFIANINGSNESLLYDFTPIIGNTWEANPFLIGITNSPTTIQLIKTVNFGDTIINGYSVNWIDVASQNPDSLIFSGRIHNHFGMKQFFPFWRDGTVDITPYLWQCYRDNLIGEIGQTPCIDIETLSIEGLEACDYKITTDSKNNQLIVNTDKCPSEFSISIFDLSGRLIISKDKHYSNSVDLSLKQGLYICRIQSNSKIFNQKFFWQ